MLLIIAWNQDLQAQKQKSNAKTKIERKTVLFASNTT